MMFSTCKMELGSHGIASLAGVLNVFSCSEFEYFSSKQHCDPSTGLHTAGINHYQHRHLFRNQNLSKTPWAVPHHFQIRWLSWNPWRYIVSLYVKWFTSSLVETNIGILCLLYFIQLIDSFFKELEQYGESLTEEGYITLSDIEDSKSNKGGSIIISTGLPAYCLLQLLLRSVAANSQGLLLSKSTILASSISILVSWI